MNKTLTFFTAPITAFFYPPVYRDAAKSSAGRGVLYLLYLAGLSAVFVMMALSAKVMPQVDAFADWAGKNMPVLVWTPDGLVMENGQTTAALTHPKYGTIALFDINKTNIVPADMQNAYVFITAKKVFYKSGPGQIETRDITGPNVAPGQQLPPRVRFTGDVIGKMYQNIKKAMGLIVPIMVLFFSFILFLMVNLFYSLAGLLFNLMRVEKLGYGAIFNLTCFATTGAFTLAWVRLLIPVRGLHGMFALGVLINLGLMFFAFRVTDKKPAQA